MMRSRICKLRYTLHSPVYPASRRPVVGIVTPNAGKFKRWSLVYTSPKQKDNTGVCKLWFRSVSMASGCRPGKACCNLRQTACMLRLDSRSLDFFCLHFFLFKMTCWVKVKLFFVSFVIYGNALPSTRTSNKLLNRGVSFGFLSFHRSPYTTRVKTDILLHIRNRCFIIWKLQKCFL